MTREEAIKIIKNEEECVLTDCFRPSCESCNLVMETDAILTALDMAIKALEQTEPCEAGAKMSLPECEDAVSRVDVLECFADLYDTFEDCSKGIINELHRKFDDLRSLPSVTPKQNEDSVSRKLYEQTKWERNLAIRQLADLGYGLGETIINAE